MWKLATETDRKVHRAARVVIPILLGLLTTGYAVALFFHQELRLADKIEQPLIMASLLLIIGVLVRIERRLPSDEAPEVTIYPDRTSFYEATRRAVEDARHTVHVSYLRAWSPDELDDAVQRHVEACRKWADRSHEHSFRRVIVNGTDLPMVGFLEQELAEVRHARANKRHYNVRLFDRGAQAQGMVSIGLYDGEQVFVSYSIDTDSIMGMSIRSRKVVRDCFARYFDHLWENAVPIEKYPIGDAPASASLG